MSIRARSSMTSKEGADYVHADQTEHRVRPRDLGRRLVLWQGDPDATGGRVRGGGRPTQPGHAQRRRRNSNPHAGRVSAPAILVGHSYGGTVITAAGTDERVAGLVYIAALA